MPHCILEYSDNISFPAQTRDLLKKLNLFIAESFPVDVRKIKSRAVCQSSFAVADGSDNQGFIHLELVVLEGRSEDDHEGLSRSVLEFLKVELADVLEDGSNSLSVNLRVMSQNTYVKEVYGNIL